MKPHSIIKVFPSKDINKDRWNDCIRSSKDGGSLYATYEYLCEMANNWDGIVVNDYEAIIPLPFRRKMGIRYCYDVPFIQQLGLFGNYDCALLKQVLSAVAKHIQYGDLFFNNYNLIADCMPSVTEKCNLTLPLNQSYSELYKVYSNHLKTKLKQAAAANLSFQFNNDFEETISLFQSLYSSRLPQIKADSFLKLKKLANLLEQTNRSFACTAFDSKGTILARALFFKDDHRIYNILPSTTNEGRKGNAMHFLLDNLIQHFAKSQYTLDFEGSDIPGIKAFYQSFGAINKPYYHYHYNRLPLPFRWLKK